MLDKSVIENWFQELQDSICKSITRIDGKSSFKEDLWSRDSGGGGRTRVISGGDVIEKGGVNFSAVYGATPEKILKALGLAKSDFFATGVSIVMHPKNPFVPIIHMNVRYFEMSDGTKWFGGGIDLTPHYINIEEAEFFHQNLKSTCDKFTPDYYPEFKKWADDYFFIKHRNETRGIGGIFFDRLSETHEFAIKDRWEFVKEVGMTFSPTYIQLIENNRNKSYTAQNFRWQKLRRGRYVEFNLVYDKGTKFGLDTDGRTESILISLPPEATWLYNHQPDKGSEEDKTLNLLKKGIDWINY